ncbi:thiol-disulfide oxidoreductase [Lottiidibacillus patelloidae]|uniref:Thiol-disulfide oxidoreductase n=1 Tax=Lottiidibacillus patelloidae TaxID=2670334 RepID=A0A263BRI7_9BACI|nr:thiol-disulfide oxidoreductase DCC family protein [Lottiidibacillus patelloidae]OZM56323.1 thiol-disulfide oxidoreductase [Lottiidibacillus patelloidae]
MEKIILFDGVCNLCNFGVQFVIKRDPKKQFKFASIQSEIGEKLMIKHYGKVELDSFVYIEGKNSYKKSTAALKVCKHLRGAWKLLFILLIIPTPIRDFFYGKIAKNRYKMFGKKDSCMLPSPELKERFLS